MPYLLNVIYFVGLLALSPWLLYKSLTTGKYRRGLWAKLNGSALARSGTKPRAWFHGVSVGEIHLLTQVVSAFRRRFPSHRFPNWECVISTTTDTGFAEAQKRFPDLPVFYWPLDFTWSVRRAIQRVKPSLIIVAEGELWPNFLAQARRSGVPVAVVNGRMSPRSFRNWCRILGVPPANGSRSLVDRIIASVARPFVANIFQDVRLWAMQTDAYADSIRRLGAPPENVCVTGNVKYDGVLGDRDNLRTREMATLLTIRPNDLVLVAGSTQSPEEEVILGIFQRLLQAHRQLRLILVPRQKERFDEVAHLLDRNNVPFMRLSELKKKGATDVAAVILGDTFGDLSAIWGLATVAYVGGSLDGKRGGQNMIEPAGYGAAVVFGPHVWNFRDTAERLTTGGAAIQIHDAAELETTVRRLFDDAAEGNRIGAAARELVKQQQGATERTIDQLAAYFDIKS